MDDTFDFPNIIKYNTLATKRMVAPELVPGDQSNAIDAFFRSGQAFFDIRFVKMMPDNPNGGSHNFEPIPGKVFQLAIGAKIS